MSAKRRMTLLIVLDSFIVLSAIYIGYFILYPYHNVFTNKVLFLSVITIQFAHHFFAWRYGLYRKAWSYASIGELRSIFKSVTLSIAFVMLIQFAVTQNIYFRVLCLTWMIHMLLIGGSRLSWRLMHEMLIRNKIETATIRTMVIGAGQAGRMVVRQVLENPKSGMKPILFVDDDGAKCGLEIYGVKVINGIDHIPKIVKEHDIEKVIIALPSLSRKSMAKLSNICIETGVKTQTIPRIEDLITGKISFSDIRDVKIEDLLGREEVELDLNTIADKLTGKVILVTGAGGSIGSEICRQVSVFQPKQIILLGHGENSIYTIDMELRKMYPTSVEIVPIIADIKDKDKVFEIVSDYRPDVVYHAAAHKHVPLMEANPIEAVKNNIFGTKNLVEAADTFGVTYFVMVSTDKAVNPPNVMGATKRFAEMVVQNTAKDSGTKFAAVRFGNVLGSRGSVIPLFTQQIKQGGPVTVTDPEMTRYFMTIPEASRLVIQAGALAAGGEVFVLDMGNPVKIVDLAKNLIKLSGYTEDEIEIEFSGIRPGEKLYEELLNKNEIQSEQIFPKIYVGKATPISKTEMNFLLENLLDMNERDMKDILVNLANGKSIDEKRRMPIAL